MYSVFFYSESVSTIYFKKYKRKVVFPVIYLFIYDSWTFFMLNMTFEVALSTVFLK